MASAVLHDLRFAHQADDDLGDERHGAFGAGEQAGEVVAGQVEFLAAGLEDGAVGEDEFEAEDVVGGDAVRESMRAAGVFRDIAADGAGALAGGSGA